MDEPEALMAWAIRGDQRSFEELIERFRRSVFAFFYRLTWDRSTAEDLTQETFLRAYRGAPTFKPGRQFSPWLFGIAAHLWKEHRRRSTREQGHLVEAEVSAIPQADDPVLSLEAREAEEIVRKELNQLPHDDQVVLLLRHYEGLSYQEIGDALGIPLGTVKSRLHYALERLGRALEQRGLSP